MKSIVLHKRGEAGYEAACDFASHIYETKLGFNLTKFPDMFFTVYEGQRLAGSMGFNRQMACPLFLNDKRFSIIRKRYGNDTLGEQSVLVMDNCFLGISSLAAAMFEYAYHIGVKRAGFAGTPVAFKALEFVGIYPDRFGFADPEAVPAPDRPNYRKWFDHNDPELAIINTYEVAVVSEVFFTKMAKRVEMTGNLKDEIIAFRKTFKHGHTAA